MSPEGMGIIERLFKAAIFVPVMALAAWWIFSNWLERTLTGREALIGFGFLAVAFVLGAISIISGGWGFLGVIGLLYVAALALATREYLQWRRREREHFLSVIAKCEETVARDPTNAAAYSFLGEAHLKVGNFDDASKAFGKALELDPESKRDRGLLRLARERRSESKWRRLD